MRDVHEGILSLQVADDEQSKFAHEIKNIDKDAKSVEKKVFLITLKQIISDWKYRSNTKIKTKAWIRIGSGN